MTGLLATSSSPADPYLLTVSGQRVSLLNPKPEQINLRDISHALGQMVRFNGHTKRMYTVAEHSVLVSWLLGELQHDARLQMLGLFHDAAEAYIGDVPTPVKWAMDAPGVGFGPYVGTGAFREIERRLDAAINTRFKLAYTPGDHTIIKAADTIALSMEARDLLPDGLQWPGVLPKPHDFSVEVALMYVQILCGKGIVDKLPPDQLFRARFLELARELHCP